MFMLQFTQEEVNSYCQWLFAIIIRSKFAQSKEKVWRWLDSVNNSSPVLKMSEADTDCSDIGGGDQISVTEVLASNPDRSAKLRDINGTLAP